VEIQDLEQMKAQAIWYLDAKTPFPDRFSPDSKARRVIVVLGLVIDDDVLTDRISDKTNRDRGGGRASGPHTFRLIQSQCALSATDPCTWVSGRMLRPAEMKGLVVPHLSRWRLHQPEYRCSGMICGGTCLDAKFRRQHRLVSRCSQICAAVNATATKWVEQMSMPSMFYRLRDGTLATIKPAYVPPSTNGLSNYPPLFCSSCHFTVRAHQSNQWLGSVLQMDRETVLGIAVPLMRKRKNV
jgi:hypothetical protein